MAHKTWDQDSSGGWNLVRSTYNVLGEGVHDSIWKNGILNYVDKPIASSYLSHDQKSLECEECWLKL